MCQNDGNTFKVYLNFPIFISSIGIEDYVSVDLYDFVDQWNELPDTRN